LQESSGGAASVCFAMGKLKSPPICSELFTQIWTPPEDGKSAWLASLKPRNSISIQTGCGNESARVRIFAFDCAQLQSQRGDDFEAPMSDARVNPYADIDFKLSVQSFSSGLIVAFLLTWVCLVCFVILCVPILIPLTKYKETLDQMLHLSKTQTSGIIPAGKLSGYQISITVTYITIICAFLVSAPIQATLWGARAFCNHDLRNAAIFLLLWAAWIYMWNWTMFFSYDDLLMPIVASIYLLANYTLKIKSQRIRV
jgi:hypothetical protein